MISSDVASTLNENFSGLTLELIKNQLENQGRNCYGRRHSDEAKKFALTLNFYSPRAYEYVRSVFALPHSRSLSCWTSSVECAAGLFQDVFKKLKLLVKNKPEQADCSLICDAMSIKKNIFYNRSTGKYDGYIDYGKDVIVEDEDVVAKEALVIMLVSHRGQWKYPVGYVLIDEIKADALNSLIARILDLCVSHDLIVRTVTLDGTATNLSAMKLFGCKLGKSIDDIDGSFSYERFDHKLYFTPDPPHMLKLARNALCELGVFVDGEGKLIKWSYIQKLHEEQTSLGLKFANKLSNSHINIKRHKMNARLAAQTLSSSVADALQFLMESGHPEFIHAGATILFILDRLFDLLNAKSPQGKGFKQPIPLNNEFLWKDIIKNSITYLANLKDASHVPLLQHRRKTFVLGFITSALSTQGLALYLLNKSTNPFSYLLPYL